MPDETTGKGKSIPRHDRCEEAIALSDLPPDELWAYGVELGLDLKENTPPDEAILQIRQRQELLIELDRDALLDVIVWSRSPVRRSAGKEELAREIARIQQANYQCLSLRGLVALARLRGIPASALDDSEELIIRLRRQEGFWQRLARKRRSLAGSLVTRLLDGSKKESNNDYRFLPEEAPDDGSAAQESLKTQIEEHGLVGGLANRLRGAADDYVRVKLDEIEDRIDAKLDEIDKRLGQWRDREVANRLKILRITLIFTVLVAILSLGYNMVNSRVAVEDVPKTKQTQDQP